jgi:hypothetical protein
MIQNNMTSELQKQRKNLVTKIQELSYKKLENQYCIFEVQTFNPNSLNGEEWFSIYQMKNGKLELKYSPTNESEYGTLDSTSSIDMILTYLKKNKINKIYSLAGISHNNNLFGLDMTQTYENEEEYIDAYQINPIFSQSDCVVKFLKFENINIEIPFLTKKSLTKYY